MELCRFFYPETLMCDLPVNRAERRAVKSKTYRKAYKKPIYAKKYKQRIYERFLQYIFKYVCPYIFHWK